jgi:drug/metabolite transporter (DMT)-like permease
LIEAAIYGLATAVLWGAADFISRKPVRSVGYYLASGYALLLGLFEILAYVLVFQGIDTTVLLANNQILIVSLLVGVSNFIAITFLYRGFATGMMSVVSPVASAYPLVAVVLSILFLGQVLTPVKAYAISTVLVGIVLVGIRLSELRKPGTTDPPIFPSSEKESGSNQSILSSSNINHTKNPKTRKFYKGMGSAIVAFFASGFSTFGLVFVTPILGATLPVVLIRIGGTLASFAILIPLRQVFKLPNASTFLWLVIVSSIDTTGVVVFNFGVLTARGNLPVLVTLSGLLSLVPVTLARIFYQERLDKIQVFGIFVLLVGVATLLYF